ncbi:MAG: hypothetical protein EOP64_10795 [Sphingomonas sp.]|nr:MAG: hypothetical protein EOP64_10795 [Sphingomonas sp.]
MPRIVPSVILTKVRIQSHEGCQLLLWILTFVRMTAARMIATASTAARGAVFPPTSVVPAQAGIHIL